MNHLVFLDARASELEKILSGVKTMLVKEFDPANYPLLPVHPGDSLYFLRGQGDCAVRVKATVVRVLFFTKPFEEDLTDIMKEMQPKLHLTEDQYNDWSLKKQVQLVEFGAALKIGLIRVALNKIQDRGDWISFEDFSLMMD
jgi:hypothetical protein